MTSLYLWDLGNTLFQENWSSRLSGFKSVEAYFISRGLNPKIMSQHDWEWQQEECYKKGWMCQNIFPGFKELLEFTQNNQPFSRGNKEQLDWRAEYLNPKAGFDIRTFFGEFNSAIDRWGTNIKAPEMFRELISEKYAQEYNSIIYGDDDAKNGQMFLAAAEAIRSKKDPMFIYRFYHCLHDGKGLRQKPPYYEVASLWDILENEKHLL